MIDLLLCKLLIALGMAIVIICVTAAMVFFSDAVKDLIVKLGWNEPKGKFKVILCLIFMLTMGLFISMII